MPRKCCIVKCTNSQTFSNEKISFHSFPSNQEEYVMWKHIIKSNTGQEIDGYKHKICSRHFPETEIKVCGTRFFLNPAALPSIFPQTMNSELYQKHPQLNAKCTSVNDSTPTFKRQKRKTNSVQDMPNSISYRCDVSSDNCNTGSTPLSHTEQDSVMFGDGLHVKNLEKCSVPNVDPVLHSLSHSTPKRAIGYSGDIDIDELEKQRRSRAIFNITLCKDKIKAQAKQIYHLKQIERRKHERIEKLKKLLSKAY